MWDWAPMCDRFVGLLDLVRYYCGFPFSQSNAILKRFLPYFIGWAVHSKANPVQSKSLIGWAVKHWNKSRPSVCSKPRKTHRVRQIAGWEKNRVLWVSEHARVGKHTRWEVAKENTHVQEKLTETLKQIPTIVCEFQRLFLLMIFNKFVCSSLPWNLCWIFRRI